MTATTEPSRVTAGDTITWLKSLPDYPANAAWVLVYTLINAAGKKTITATASGADHLVTVPAATSAAWAPGSYTLLAAITKGTERYTLGTSALEVAPDLAAAATFDVRSSVQKALDAANLALETFGNKAYLQMYEVNGRRQQFHTPGEFLSYRSKLLAEVAREKAAAGLAAGIAPKNKLFVRFKAR